jgi:hypothetical protein
MDFAGVCRIFGDAGAPQGPTIRQVSTEYNLRTTGLLPLISAALPQCFGHPSKFPLRRAWTWVRPMTEKLIEIRQGRRTFASLVAHVSLKVSHRASRSRQ